MPSISLAGILFGLASSTALANDWDWDWEKDNRVWTPVSLSWASDIHPQHPSPILILLTTPPPPHEIWCDYNAQPSPADELYFEELLEDWTRDFLNLAQPAALPNGMLASFPPEC